MENTAITKLCEDFFKQNNLPGFIIIGTAKEGNPNDFQISTSYHKVPLNIAIKGLSNALYQLTNQVL